ncbi:MAG: hypothetical protein ACYTJ0_06685 [Planctomycetota bacterium]|jgi:hypothetical protein
MSSLQARMVFSRADVTDPQDLLGLVRSWPEDWRDAFDEREAIMAVQARFPWAVAIREAFKDCLRLAAGAGVPLAGADL